MTADVERAATVTNGPSTASRRLLPSAPPAASQTPELHDLMLALEAIDRKSVV